MKVLIFGDSHSVYFTITNEMLQNNDLYRGINTDVLSIAGSTIGGFGKRESTLNSNIQLKDRLKNNYDYIVFSLGQVDLELGLYYRIFIKNEVVDITNFINDLISRYMSAIKNTIEEQQISPDRIVLKGINLSALTLDRSKAIRYTKRIITENISDIEEIKILHQKMVNSFPSGLERNFNHKLFNRLLKEAAQKLGYKYFDVNEEITNKNGLIDYRYIPVKQDHHLVDSVYIRSLHIDKLLSAIFK